MATSGATARPTHLALGALEAVRSCDYAINTASRHLPDGIALTLEGLEAARAATPYFALGVENLFTRGAWLRLLRRQIEVLQEFAVDRRSYKRAAQPYLETRP